MEPKPENAGRASLELKPWERPGELFSPKWRGIEVLVSVSTRQETIPSSALVHDVVSFVATNFSCTPSLKGALLGSWRSGAVLASIPEVRGAPGEAGSNEESLLKVEGTWHGDLLRDEPSDEEEDANDGDEEVPQSMPFIFELKTRFQSSTVRGHISYDIIPYLSAAGIEAEELMRSLLGPPSEVLSFSRCKLAYERFHAREFRFFWSPVPTLWGSGQLESDGRTYRVNVGARAREHVEIGPLEQGLLSLADRAVAAMGGGEGAEDRALSLLGAAKKAA